MNDFKAAGLLFADDGSVKLPKYVNLAIAMAVESMKPIPASRRPKVDALLQCQAGLLTRQPTRERAEAIQVAIADRVAQRGFDLEIRSGAHGMSYGLFLKVPEPVGTTRVGVSCAKG